MYYIIKAIPYPLFWDVFEARNRCFVALRSWSGSVGRTNRCLQEVRSGQGLGRSRSSPEKLAWIFSEFAMEHGWTWHILWMNLWKNDNTKLRVKPGDFPAMLNYQGRILSKCYAMGFKFACVCYFCETCATDKHLVSHCNFLKEWAHQEFFDFENLYSRNRYSREDSQSFFWLLQLVTFHQSANIANLRVQRDKRSG